MVHSKKIIFSLFCYKNYNSLNVLDMNELNQMSMKRENERVNLYQKLFFMNGK